MFLALLHNKPYLNYNIKVIKFKACNNQIGPIRTFMVASPLFKYKLI